MMAELLIDGVGKRYERERWALRDLTLRPGAGVLGLVGPNGAGKTTLLRILATLLAPTEGVVTWDGEDIARRPAALRRTLGYLPQDFGAYPQLTAREFLRYIGELKGLAGAPLARRVEAALEMVRLREDADRRLRGFSGGMVRRVGIAQALLTEPRLLVLDEPTVGLDPAERVRFRETLATLGGERLVLLSTHIIADVEAVATELALLQRGRLVWTGTPAGLLADAAGSTWALTLPAAEFAARRAGWQLSAAVRRGDAVEARLVAPARPHPLAAPVAPTLEEAYLRFAAEAPAVADAPVGARAGNRGAS
jgi:ABC-2 type transport system ATP-binding protein